MPTSSASPKTVLGRSAAVAALNERRENKPNKIDNASLPAGAPMYYYCISCGICLIPSRRIGLLVV